MHNSPIPIQITYAYENTPIIDRPTRCIFPHPYWQELMLSEPTEKTPHMDRPQKTCLSIEGRRGIARQGHLVDYYSLLIWALLSSSAVVLN
jgi:hypothetical protein